MNDRRWIYYLNAKNYEKDIQQILLLLNNMNNF